MEKSLTEETVAGTGGISEEAVAGTGDIPAASIPGKTPAADSPVLKNPAEENALTLAYLGDAVFELEVRKYMMLHGSRKVEKLHKHVTAFVNAGSQSGLFGLLEPMLTEEELSVYHRGRNSKTLTAAKHQTIADYRRATGFEAVMGFLYLKNDRARMDELLGVCFASLKTDGENADANPAGK